MNIIPILAQAEAAAPQRNPHGTPITMALIFAIFYFTMPPPRHPNEK